MQQICNVPKNFKIMVVFLTTGGGFTVNQVLHTDKDTKKQTLIGNIGLLIYFPAFHEYQFAIVKACEIKEQSESEALEWNKKFSRK